MATAATEVSTPHSTEDHIEENVTDQEEEEDRKAIYEKQSKQLLDDIWSLYEDADSWCEEAKSRDGKDIVTSKTIANRGKVFRLTGIVSGSSDEIVKILFEDQGEMAKWSPTVNECRILEVIHSNLYITYQLTNEQAQGLISKRDFVNITVRQYRENSTVLAAQACLHPSMPPRDNCVRAENGLIAYIVTKIDEQTVQLTWILNVDLKGWLPQYLINSSLATVQLTMIESLRNFLSNRTVRTDE